jgi:hypothetical protein
MKLNLKLIIFIVLICFMCASVSATWNIEGGKYDGAIVNFYNDNTGSVTYGEHTIGFNWEATDMETITATYYIFSIDLKYNQTDNTLSSSKYPNGKLVYGGN